MCSSDLLFAAIGILLLLVILAAILIPILFKDKIEAAVKEQVNANVNATVDWGAWDLSIISSFPNASFSINGGILKTAAVLNFEAKPTYSIRVRSTDQGEHCYQWHQGRMYNGLVVVMFALEDVNPGDGGFHGVPGSHKANHPFKPAPDSHLVVQPSLKAGDMLIFTEALVHGTRKWVSPKRRRSLLYKYSPGYSTWAEPDWGKSAQIGRAHV